MRIEGQRKLNWKWTLTLMTCKQEGLEQITEQQQYKELKSQMYIEKHSKKYCATS